MGKWTKLNLGSVVKGKEKGDSDYIKFNGRSKKLLMELFSGMDEQKGLILNLESKTAQLASLQEAVSAGKLSEENGAKARERVEKIPDFVRFEVSYLKKNEQ